MIKHLHKPRKKRTFDELVSNDKLGLFDGVTASKKKQQTSSNPLIDNFQKIIDFYEANQREPKDSDDLEESKLARALARIRLKDSLKEKVVELDRFGLLSDLDEPVEEQGFKKKR